MIREKLIGGRLDLSTKGKAPLEGYGLTLRGVAVGVRVGAPSLKLLSGPVAREDWTLANPGV